MPEPAKRYGSEELNESELQLLELQDTEPVAPDSSALTFEEYCAALLHKLPEVW